MKYKYNDGGRQSAGFRMGGKCRDCVTRAIAIASEKPYSEIHAALTSLLLKDSDNIGGADNGIKTKGKKWFENYMASLGFRWVATMGIGTGCKVHLKDGELPNGKIIARVSKHYAAIMDGVLHDVFDCSRGGTRCVYGYWEKV
jgi:hypothetical protein